MERYFTMNRISEVEKLDTAVVGLEGKAITWFQWLETRTPVRTWPDFEIELITRFHCRQRGDECSAWFFAEEKRITCDHIRDWMGRFSQKNVAKCAVRMGQCFSSTYTTVEVAAHDVGSIPDIKRNNYDFSDGIGIIRLDLARAVFDKLKLDDLPSAYQIRYAGFKGVVACWPSKGDGSQLLLRSSMDKFESTHTTLEICSWTRFQLGFLNRQIVTLLSALNVPDEVFWNMQEAMVSKLNKMLVDVFHGQSST